MFSFSIGNEIKERTSFKSALRLEKLDELDRLWALYKEGAFPYTRQQRECDIYDVESPSVVDWMITNNFLPPLVLLSQLVTYNFPTYEYYRDCTNIIEHTVQKIDNPPEKVWSTIVTSALHSNNTTVLDWVLTQGVEIGSYITDETINYLVSAQEINHDNDDITSTQVLKYLHDKGVIEFTRDTLDTAISIGKNEATIRLIISSNPNTVCQATAHLLVQCSIWNQAIWRYVLSTGKVTLSKQFLNNMIDRADYQFDGRIFIEFGANFDEEQAIIAILRHKDHVLTNLITRCGLEASQRLQEIIYKNGNTTMIDTWKRIKKSKF